MSKSRLREKYQKEVVAKLMEEFAIENIMQAPRVEKIVVNSGVGDTIKNKEAMEKIKNDMALITGQLPSVRKARVSVASFSLRKGSPVGLKVTLRGDKMYSFLDKLCSVVLPRLRDFRGIKSSAFDKFGNYTLGIVDHSVFPEVDITKVTPRGMEITVVVKSDSPKQAFRLLELLGMPFEKESKNKK